MVAPETPIKLTEILSLDVCAPQVTASDRWAVIDTMIDLLIRTGKVRAQDCDAVSSAIRYRESTKSTGIGFGVAMPHATVACVTEVVAVLARLEPPVDFLALDKQPVRICALFLSPQGQFQKHLHTLSAFARVFSDREQRRHLEKAETPEEMLAVFVTPN